ncbi:MAG TPA: RNA polymerase sigma factor [Bacteroidia bacterium]
MNTTEYNIIVRQWGPHLLRFANRNLNNMDVAKDVVQDAFEVLWKNKDEIQAEKARQYLFTVVFRKGIDVFRKNKNNVAIEEHHYEIGQMAGFEKQISDKEFVKMAMDALPEVQRQLVLLRDLEGYDYKELEAITGLNESQVKVYLFRARKALKETITTMEAL